jgi:translocation and assembly module TamA
VKRYLRYEEGDWYDAAELLRTQFALDDSQYFAVVEVLPEQRDRERHIAPIRIAAEPARRNVYTIALGYATDTRTRATLRWEDRRVNPSGHRMLAEIRGSSPEESLKLAYVIPWTDPALEKLAFEARAFNEQRADVETSGTSFRVGLTQVRGRWQRVLSVTAESTRDEVTTSNGTSTEISRTRSELLVPGISYALLPPGFLGVNAVPRGFQVELLGSSTALGSDTDFTRLVVRDERRFRLADRWHLQVRGEIGVSAVAEFQELPAQYRFFAGGDRSVRGYGYEELSPVDAEGNRIGARNLVTGSVELQRSLPRNFVAAVFVDAGNAIDNFGDPLEYSVGVGLRYRLPFVSIGFDVAQSISESDRSPRLHLNFTPEL